MGMWLSVEQKNTILERVLKNALFGMHYLCSSHSRHLVAHPTAHLSFPPVHSHCGVFLEQAASLSGWWMLSRTQASLTKSWHCCQMPSCSLCGKSVKSEHRVQVLCVLGLRRSIAALRDKQFLMKSS